MHPQPSKHPSRAQRRRPPAIGLQLSASLPLSLSLIFAFMVSTAMAPAFAQAGASGQRPTAEQRQAMLEEQLATKRPIPAVDSVWIEDLTWMEVRDAMAAGKKTVLVTSGGVEQNGPYLVTGKHNVILRGTCDRIARELGDALCAPVIKLVPEGGIDPPTGHMLFPGTLSVRESTYQAMLEDVAASLNAHGFENVVFLGDSGGNQAGMAAVATKLNDAWGKKKVHYIAEYYRYEELFAWVESGLGIKEPINEGLHDNYAITAMMMTIDPSSVRYEQRKQSGKTTINGVDIEPVDRTLEVGEKLMQRKVDQAVAAIRAAIKEGSK